MPDENLNVSTRYDKLYVYKLLDILYSLPGPWLQPLKRYFQKVQHESWPEWRKRKRKRKHLEAALFSEVEAEAEAEAEVVMKKLMEAEAEAVKRKSMEAEAEAVKA